MARFNVTKTEDRLTLSAVPDIRRGALGCAFFLISFAALCLLAVFAILYDLAAPGTDNGFDPTRFVDPTRNHFGFLWLVGSAIMLVLVPIYVAGYQRAAVTLVFDRDEGLMRRNGKVVTRLARIEFIRFSAAHDPAGSTLYRVALAHNDGFELMVDETYDIDEARNVTEDMREFLGVDVRRA